MEQKYNELMVLDDLTDFLARKDGFIIVRKNFTLSEQQGTIVDLGFRHQAKSYQDEGFYSIPIVYYSPPLEDMQMYSNIQKISEMTERNRFLSKLNGAEPFLIEVDGFNVRSVEYWRGKYHELVERDSEFDKKIRSVLKEFYAAARA